MKIRVRKLDPTGVCIEESEMYISLPNPIKDGKLIEPMLKYHFVLTTELNDDEDDSVLESHEYRIIWNGKIVKQ